MRKYKVWALVIGASTLGAFIGPQSAMATTGRSAPHNARARVVSELGSVHGLISAGTARGDAATGSHATITLRGSRHTASAVSRGVDVTPDALPNIDAATISGTNDVSDVFVLRDAQANTDVTYTVNAVGDTLVADPLGGVFVVNSAGTADGRVSAPWAYDAVGRSLPTSYTIAGDTITQHVDTSGAVFPVVADPHYTWGWVTGTIYFNKVETIKAAASVTFFGALAAFAPFPYNLYLVASAGWFVLVASWAAADGECLKLKIEPPAVFPQEYGGGYCR